MEGWLPSHGRLAALPPSREPAGDLTSPYMRLDVHSCSQRPVHLCTLVYLLTLAIAYSKTMIGIECIVEMRVIDGSEYLAHIEVVFHGHPLARGVQLV